MEETTGKILARYRVLFGHTQASLAEKLGMSQQQVSKLENDKTSPSLLYVLSLAQQEPTQRMVLFEELYRQCEKIKKT